MEGVERGFKGTRGCLDGVCGHVVRNFVFGTCAGALHTSPVCDSAWSRQALQQRVMTLEAANDEVKARIHERAG